MFVASEGWCCRYEVLSLRDGYLVQMRDVATGDLDQEFSTLFRTLPVAVAYAVMSAAYERFAELEADEEGLEELEAELELSELHFVELSNKLGDVGYCHSPQKLHITGTDDHDASALNGTYH